MHLKRVPIAPAQRALFVGAYVIQALATIAVAGIALLMSFGEGGYLQILIQNDVELMWVLCGFAVLLVVLSWLDEGLELALQGGEEGNGENAFLVSPFGFWWCLHPAVSPEEILAEEAANAAAISNNTLNAKHSSSGRLSEFSPLLGESVARMKISSVDLGIV